MGSVKDLEVLEEPTDKKAGLGRFVFSDRYSVFDWGEMPDHIKNKGRSLCLIGAWFFERLKGMGIKSHYKGLVENGQVRSINNVGSPPDTLEVKLLRVLKPRLNKGHYDYSLYKTQTGNFLIPLEVIYRNSLPPSSSVFKRLNNNSLKLKDIGLNKIPEPGQKLENPLLDVSTKLEEIDRYMDWKEAQNISGLTDQELSRIKEITLIINQLITDEVQQLGLQHEDGKIEFGMDENRQIVLVDVLGTPDECRFTYKGIPVSKEAARIFYRKTEWFKEVEEAKKKDKVNWKKRVSSPPPPLSSRLQELIPHLYQSFCNQITKKQWFNVPSLEEVMAGIDEALK
ncbi:MAG: phosphoribosylaminoimidazolesuccinocarboxamide synthase [Spirochaetes bacterium]|nr:phosphoribosylaminoimidazolesuccinocarboxamide synthase [Spirochaetota bacterium]